MKVVYLLCLVWLATFSPAVSALDVRVMIEKAVVLVDQGQPDLARSFLDPALIAPDLHESERSRAYYVRGFSFYDQRLYVSARLDYNRALEFNPDNPGALIALGDLHRGGLGIEKNLEYAFQLYEKAAKLGHAAGKVLTGRALLLGEGIKADLREARRWLAEAASEGDANAMLHLGASFRMKDSDQFDPEQAQAWYLKGAAAGATEGLINIGFMYAKGDFGAPNPIEAFRFYLQAAERGLAAAQTLVGFARLEGEGTRRNLLEATQWFEKAAAQGDPRAEVALGYLHEAGEGQPANRELALKWYRRAALAGDREGIERYAWMKAEDADLTSQREAVIWLKKLVPDDAAAANSAAWILATSTHAELRNGADAVRLAELAVQKSNVSANLDTLAAAHAESGNFDKAVEVQKDALAALTTAEARFKPEIEKRLAIYQEGRAWRE